MERWKDFWAGVQIFFSNFNARFGWILPTVLIAAAAALLILALYRALMAGRGNKRSFSPLRLREADARLTGHAAETLSAAVAIPTVTGDADGIARLNAYLRERFPELGRRASWAVTEDGSMLLCWRAGKKSEALPVLFCGHLDTVPPGSGWTTDPFSGERRDGMVCGRGAVDCKATVVALLEAGEALAREGFTPARDLYFAFGSDEETGGNKGASRMAEGFSRRGLRFALVLDEGGYIAENQFDRGNHAAALVGVGEKRSCSYRLTATAAGGHSSTPERHTATGALCEAMCRIEGAQPHHRILPVIHAYLQASLPAMTFGKRFTVCNLPFSGAFLTKVFRNDPRVLALLRSTVVPTQLSGAPAPNILPVTAGGTVNARLLPGAEPGEMLSHLRALVADLPVRVEQVSDSGPCSVTPADAPMFQLLRDVLQDHYARLPVLATLSAGATDCRHYAPLTDCALRFTPLVRSARENAGVHGADEALPEHSLGLAVETYMNLMKKL